MNQRPKVETTAIRMMVVDPVAKIDLAKSLALVMELPEPDVRAA